MSCRLLPSPRLCIALTAGCCLLVLAVALPASVHSNGFRTNEDAFISFRFAENVADGHGFRFNHGDPPVEGYSNFLLVALLAGARALGLSVIQSATVIGIAALALTIGVMVWVVQTTTGPSGLWAPAALALSALAVRTSVNGMETCLYGLLLFSGVALYIRGFDSPVPRTRALVASGVLLAAAGLTRPEGPLFVLVLAASRTVFLWRRRRRTGGLDLRADLAWLGSFSVVYLPYLVWRVVYFGDLLPNVYYAKELRFVSEAFKLKAGAGYLVLNCLSSPLFIGAVLLGIVVLIAAPSFRLRALLLVIFTQSFFLLVVGGDWPHMFGHGRHLYPVFALCLWVLADVFSWLWRSVAPRVAVVGLAVLLCVLSLAPPPQEVPLNLPAFFVQTAPKRSMVASVFSFVADRIEGRTTWSRRVVSLFSMESHLTDFDGRAGRWLSDRYGGDTRVATIQAGQFAYWSGFHFFDMFGLVTRDVARSDYSPRSMEALIRRYDPRLIAFYKTDPGVHHAWLIHTGFLERLGFGLRYWLHGSEQRTFVVFERGYPSRLDPRSALFASLPELEEMIPPANRVFLGERPDAPHGGTGR